MGNGFSGQYRWMGVLVLSVAAAAYAVPGRSTTTAKIERVPGSLIVKTRDTGIGAPMMSAMLGHFEVLDVHPFVTDEKLHVVQLADDAAVDQAIEELKAEPAVQFAEPNYKLHLLGSPADGIPNDKDFGKLWGMLNQGQADNSGQVGSAGSDINVVPVWKQGFHGSRKIVVAIIDTGIDWTHPDLKANLYTNTQEIAGNGKDDDGNGFVDDIHGWNFAAKNNNTNDDQNHGSHCAGTIGGVGNNGEGIAGVNWEVSILPIKFLTAEGSGTLADAVDAINYATKMKVNVMSNSWGGGGFSQAMEDAIKAARDAGILFVAAAGNETNNNDATPGYPASYKVDNVLAVAASDNLDKLASFSNWGATSVHVAAPGVQIYSSAKGGKYMVMSGTSMATPHVAGIAALLMAAHPELNYAEVKERLIKTSTPVRGLKHRVVANGRVNAFNAINNIVPPSTDPDPSQWQSVAQVVESVHPYDKNANTVFPITVPGAKYLRVHFEKVETEANYDKVTIETESGEAVETLTGSVTDYTSDYVEAGKLNVRLKSDFDQNAWGFKIDRIDYIK